MGQSYKECVIAVKCLNLDEDIARITKSKIKMDILASQHSVKKFDKFWKGTKKLNSKNSLPASIDGASDPKLIANIFREAFRVSSDLPSKPGSESYSLVVKRQIKFSAKDVAGIVHH